MQEVTSNYWGLQLLENLLSTTYLDGFRTVMAASFLLILHQSLCGFSLFQSLMQEEL